MTNTYIKYKTNFIVRTVLTVIYLYRKIIMLRFDIAKSILKIHYIEI